MKNNKIIELLLSQYHDQGTELKYNNEFELLCAVILSAQTTDKRVNLVTPNLFKIANNPKQMLELGVEKIASYIKTVGLYQAKSLYLYTMSAQLLKHFAGKVPNNYTDLISLAGVGRKTANVILNTLYKQPVIAVDTHVFRLAKRLALSDGNTPLKVEQDLMKNIAKKYLLVTHNLLVLHGRYICTAKHPKCSQCVIQSLCDHYKLSNNSA